MCGKTFTSPFLIYFSMSIGYLELLIYNVLFWWQFAVFLSIKASDSIKNSLVKSDCILSSFHLCLFHPEYLNALNNIHSVGNTKQSQHNNMLLWFDRDVADRCTTYECIEETFKILISFINFCSSGCHFKDFMTVNCSHCGFKCN